MAYYTLSPEDNKIFESANSDFKKSLQHLQSISTSDSPIILDLNRLQKAWEIAKFWHGATRRVSGELYIYHPLAVFNKMVNDGFIDVDVLAAALLHDTIEDTPYTLAQLLEDFNSNVCNYVDAVTNIKVDDTVGDDLKRLKAQWQTDEHYLEIGRRNPLAFYIKFADRWHNLRTAQRMPPESIQRTVAHTRQFLIPLARKLGCIRMAAELEDACMFALYPKEYSNILTLQTRSLSSSSKTLNRALRFLTEQCKHAADIDQNYELPFPNAIAEELRKNGRNPNLRRPDLFSHCKFRPYVLVHFKIKSPSEEPLNSQFLHIISPLIRDNIFSIENEHTPNNVGDAQVLHVDITDRYCNLLRVVVYTKEYRNTISDCRYERIVRPIPPEKRMHVYTRDGERMTIETGSTVLDFAFALNTEIGARYESARVNGESVSIDYVLKDGDTVVIQKADHYTADLDWFYILETKSARKRLVDFLKRRNT